MCIRGIKKDQTSEAAGEYVKEKILAVLESASIDQSNLVSVTAFKNTEKEVTY